MKAPQIVMMARMEIMDTLNAVGNKYQLPAYMIEFLVSDCLSEIRSISKQELLASMSEEKENENADTESKN